MTKANKLDFTLDQFTDEQRTALAGWYKHFTARYPVVGRLREYVASLNLLWPDVHTFEFWRSNPKCPIAKLYSGQQVAVLEKAIKRELRQQRLSILLRMDGIFLLSRRRPMDFVKFCRHWQKDPKIFEKPTLLCCGLISKTHAKRHLVSLTCLRGWEAAAFWPQGRHNAGTSCGRASHVPSWRQGNWVLFKCFLVLTWFHCFDLEMQTMQGLLSLSSFIPFKWVESIWNLPSTSKSMLGTLTIEECQVKLHGLEDNELNGKIGTLRSLVASTGKFAIEMDGEDTLCTNMLTFLFCYNLAVHWLSLE